MPCPKDYSRVDSSGRAYAGSQRQIQTYVNRYPAELTSTISAALALPSEVSNSIRWVSPLEDDSYSEYRDEEFLTVVGLSKFIPHLRKFWPRRGPCWDALAVIPNGCILVEAKSHGREIYGNGCGAGFKSRLTICKSIQNTKMWLNSDSKSDWLGALYQSANRYAFLYFLREIVNVQGFLVNIYFELDSRTPTSRQDWQQAIAEVNAGLGLRTAVPFSASAFLPARS